MTLRNTRTVSAASKYQLARKYGPRSTESLSAGKARGTCPSALAMKSKHAAAMGPVGMVVVRIAAYVPHNARSPNWIEASSESMNAAEDAAVSNGSMVGAETCTPQPNQLVAAAATPMCGTEPRYDLKEGAVASSQRHTSPIIGSATLIMSGCTGNQYSCSSRSPMSGALGAVKSTPTKQSWAGAVNALLTHAQEIRLVWTSLCRAEYLLSRRVL